MLMEDTLPLVLPLFLIRTASPQRSQWQIWLSSLDRIQGLASGSLRACISDLYQGAPEMIPSASYDQVNLHAMGYPGSTQWCWQIARLALATPPR